MSAALPFLLSVLLLADPGEAERVGLARTVVEAEDGAEERAVLESAREAESIHVAADRTDFDRNSGVILFDGHARVSHSSGYRMDADRLWLFFSGSNSFERLVAEGHVAISNDLRRGSCALACFRRQLGEIELFGEKGGEPARLQETGADEVSGRRIRIWVDSEQIEVLGTSTVEVEKGKGGLKQQ